MTRVASVLDLIGHTPMVDVSALSPTETTRIWLKLEGRNPAGSVKDRVALALVEAAERDGVLVPGKPDQVLVEPTSGNTGIGLALVCAVKGYPLTLVMPETTSLEHRQALEAYGAELVLTPADGVMGASVERAREIAAHDDALLLDQFANPANPAAHREGTAGELRAAFDALGAPPDALVAGVGTGGTLTGVAQALRAEWPRTRFVAVEPAASAVLSGGPPGPTRIQGLGAGFVPAVLDRSAYDEVVPVEDETAWELKVRLAREEGILAGVSSGAAAWAALEVAHALGPGRVVATIFPDTGERYFSVAEWFDAPAGARR